MIQDHGRPRLDQYAVLFERALGRAEIVWYATRGEALAGWETRSKLPEYTWVQVLEPGAKTDNRTPWPEDNPEEQHIPDRSQVLTSDPPQWYCSNPGCYCHPCDWKGWEDDG